MMATYFDQPFREEAATEMSTASRLYHGITDHFRFRLVSWIMSFHVFAFGLIITHSPEVMSLPGRESLYAGLLRIAPAPFWGVFCIVVGSFRLASLIVNGSFPAFTFSPHIRLFGSFLSSLFWLQIWLGAWHSPTWTLAFDVFFTYCVLDGAALYLAAIEINPEGTRKPEGT